MWLNQNFLLPEGVDSTDVTFNSLRGRGLLSISMASNGQVQPQLCGIIDDLGMWTVKTCPVSDVTLRSP